MGKTKIFPIWGRFLKIQVLNKNAIFSNNLEQLGRISKKA